MAYITQTDIENRIGATILIQLTDDDGDGVADASVVNKAISDAEAEVNGYVGTRYSVPLDPVPAIVSRWTTSIAVYLVYQHRRGASETVQYEYEQTVKALDKVSRGLITLGANEPETTTPEVGGVTVDAPEPVITLDAMKGL